MNKPVHPALIMLFLWAVPVLTSFAQEDNTKYIDPTIGNVARFLVPTYPTMHLPNQMLRMFPVREDYISDEVVAFPLQVVSHRSKGLFQMKVSAREITGKSWERKMYVDHDLERVHPWYYSTYLIEDDIRVSFTPGKKCAIYKLEFPETGKRNLLIRGTDELSGISEKKGEFILKDKVIYKTRGINSVTRKMTVFIYALITDTEGNLIEGVEFQKDRGKFAVSIPDGASSPILLKYAVSYISGQQAEYNFNQELFQVNFDKLAESGKKIWEETVGQIQVKGGTIAQRRTFYTSLYRTYERMVDINEYGKYYSGYDATVHESGRPFYVEDWIWDTYLAQHPLRIILNPELENDMLNS